MQNKNTIQKQIKRLLFVFTLATFTTAAAQTNTYHVQLINNSNMMSPGEIIQLMKDSKDFLWLLSPSKVQRYDGKNFITFSFDERCTNIAQDNEGTIWLASRQNIYQYKNDYTGFEKMPAYSSDTIKYLSMVCGPEKNIYVLTKNNLLQWKTATRQFEKLPADSINNRSSFPFLKSAGNYLFYQKNTTKLARYNVVTKTTDELPVKDPSYLFLINKDSAWIRQAIGSSSLVSFQTKEVLPVTASQFNEKFNDNNFFITGNDSDFSCLSFNYKGYFSYDRTTNRFSKIKLLYNGIPLNGNPLNGCFYQEQNGTVWFVNEEGLIHFNPVKSSIGLLRSNILSGENWNNTVRSFTEDTKGNIWFATANGFCNLDKLNGTVKTWLPKFDANNYLNYSSIRSIGYSNGKIIVGQSEKGFWIFNPITNTFKRPLFENDSLQKQFEGSFNTNMVQLHSGDFLILSRNVWLMDKNTFKVSPVKLSGIDPYPRDAYEDAQRRIWLVGGGGIFAFDTNFNMLYALPDKEGGKWYNAIVQVNENTFWVAKKNIFEIRLADKGTLTITPLFQELKTLHFSQLFKDSLQHIWMFSDNGVYRYVQQTRLLERFDRQDNIQPYTLSLTNTYRSKAGILYAGSSNGINYFVPERIPLTNDSLQVNLLNVSVNEDDSTFLLKGNLLPLNYNQNSLVFDFIAPYIYNGEKVKYRCRLQGADKDWVYIGSSTSMRYSSLKPGKYIFYATASLNGIHWYANKNIFSFTIAPSFWQTWWFRFLLGLLTAVLVVYFFRRRIVAVKEKEKIKTDYERKIAEVEMSSLRAQMNPHFMFNSLNSINNFILKNDPENASGYLTKFSRLMRLILDNSRSEWVLLQNELKALELYIELEALRFDNAFGYSIEVTQDVDPLTVLVPPMIIQPYVENAIWHGLLHRKTPGGKLDIHIWKNNGALNIEIEDNGVGREESLRRESKSAVKQKSHGMKITAQRLDIVNQLYNVNANVTVKDITDENGDAAGINVLVTINYTTHDGSIN